MIRTRFAPSPSGFLHLGNARTALFAFLYARHNKGRFVLRIEDTDLDRITPGSEVSIIEDLKWLNLNWDEGPDVGGPLGPYRCSERFDVYSTYLKRLAKTARVYRCFCSPDQLDQDRKLLSSQKKIIKYVGRCLSIADAESQKRADAKESFVWRMHVSDGPAVVVNDIIRDEVKMEREVLGDFVLCRSSGVPVFLFANVIDDAVQEMTHIIRGEDHLSNTFRQVMIYESLGFKVPTFAHLPMIGAEDGGKLSKRDGSLSIGDLRKEGFLPAGILNYLALLGWSPGDTAQTGEKFTLNDLIERFDLNRVHKGRALFDFQKLTFLNQLHMHDLSVEQLAEMVPPTDSKFAAQWKDAVSLIRHDCSTLLEIHKVEAYLARPHLESSALAATILKAGKVKETLESGLQHLKNLKQTSEIDVALKQAIQAAGKDLGVKGKDLFFPFRLAITGVESGPELVPLAKILGVAEVEARLESAIQFCK